MRFMNEYDLAHAIQRFDAAGATNRLRIARVVDRLRQWADETSDGWAFWPKPARAANRAMALIESTTNAENERQEEVDATDAETELALRQIKTFLTRQGVDNDTKRRIFGQED